VIGHRLRVLRYRRGWSQAVAAAKYQLAGWDVSRDTIANIELRRRWVADFEVVILAKVLGVDVRDLLPRRFDWNDVPRMPRR
jgi:transcriptional regulator with XRE-family HTH domain